MRQPLVWLGNETIRKTFSRLPISPMRWDISETPPATGENLSSEPNIDSLGCLPLQSDQPAIRSIFAGVRCISTLPWRIETSAWPWLRIIS
jgi:hypothetical protein